MTYHVRLTDNGAVTLPEKLARELGLRPGDLLAIEQDGGRMIVSREGNDPLTRLREKLRGYTVDRFLSERGGDWAE